MGVVSPTDFRRKNPAPIPLMGGLGMFLGFALAIGIATSFAMGAGSHFGELNLSLLTLGCGAVLVALGTYDDWRELSPAPKALIQVMVVVTWLWLVPQEKLLLNQLDLPKALALFLTAFWMVGVINACNMIDGMDGEAAGFALVALLTLFFVTQSSSQGWLCAAAAGSIVAFLLFNWPPAKVFMGDGGSTFLGFLLATQASALQLESQHWSMVLVPLFILAFPEVDALMSMLRRISARSSIFKGDHDHIHHRLKKMGFSVPQALAVILGATAYCGVAAFAVVTLNSHPALGSTLVLALGGLLCLLGAIFILEYRQAHQVSSFSHTIIHKHLPITIQPRFDVQNFSATVYDLLPYYKEMQLRGILQVEEFVQGVANHVRTQHPGAIYCVLGSYSIVAIESYSDLLVEKQTARCESLYRILRKFDVVKSESPIPWGMSFYTHLQKPEGFLRKFGLTQESLDKIAS